MITQKCKAAIFIMLLLISGSKAVAQIYSAILIPDSLKKNANSVVRNYSALFVQTDMNNATFKVTKVVTVLDKKGEEAADIHLSGDKFRTLSSFSGIVRDASGKEVRKIKKSDLIASTIDLGSLATDNILYFYECKYPSCPYTVEYTYEQKWKNGLLSYPTFFPMDEYSQSVEFANYTVELPSDVKIRSKSNFACEIKKEEGKNTKYSIQVDNLNAIGYEPFAPSPREIFSVLFFAPADFCYDSHCGNMQDWKNYGKWMSDLLKDRDVLSADIVAKLKDITKSASDDREKVKIIYDYLQNNTRYISIQLGIGGFQPFEAQTVYKTGFGDCKGLSNLMKAMLQAVDIPSDYCGISTEIQRLYPDYPNFNQMNHAILMVPLKSDTLWLECTSQTIPFGFVHDGIAGHDALVVTHDGGKICRLPAFSDKENKSTTNLTLNLADDGSVAGKVALTEFLEYSFGTKERDEYIKFINRSVKFPQIQIGEIKTSENKTAYPSIRLEADISCNGFANKTGTRFFVPICPLTKRRYEVFVSSSRNLDIDIETGFSESDTIVFNIPETYTVESLPKNIVLETDFGKLNTYAEQKGSQIIYIQNIDVFTGRYDKARYKDIKDFYARITAAVKRQLVLKKQA